MTLQVPGEHNARNALAACAVAHRARASRRARSQAGLADFAGRQGPAAAHAAAPGGARDRRHLQRQSGLDEGGDPRARRGARPRVLVLGDMGELGDGGRGAARRDRRLREGRRASTRLLALGAAERATRPRPSARARAHFADLEALVDGGARARRRPDATVLVKGSRFMRMERVVERARRRGGHAMLLELAQWLASESPRLQRVHLHHAARGAGRADGARRSRSSSARR